MFFLLSRENYWPDLLHLKESDKLAATSYSSVSELDFSLRENPDLVDSWKAISKHADLRTNTKFLENISGYSDDLLRQLDDDLLNPKWADKLKTLFKESPDDVTNIWKKLKEDPAEAWEISKADHGWEKWSQREFFKEVTVLGKRFEEVTRAKILDKSSDLYNSLKSSLKFERTEHR